MAENIATTQAQRDMQKLATASNPLQVFMNPIVISAAVGVGGAYWARKTFYQQRRDWFGWAATRNGRVVFWRVGPDGRPIVGQEHPSAYTNRILLNLAGVVLGTVLINNTVIEDATADYIGLGVAAGSFANLVMTVLGVD